MIVRSWQQLKVSEKSNGPADFERQKSGNESRENAAGFKSLSGLSILNRTSRKLPTIPELHNGFIWSKMAKYIKSDHPTK
jgi:hypothetical protein